MRRNQTNEIERRIESPGGIRDTVLTELSGLQRAIALA
jgi:hypothetical protein